MSTIDLHTDELTSTFQKERGEAVYILSAAAVSPQVSFEQMLKSPAIYQGEKFSCIEPDYANYIDPKLIRRMSRIIKMGMASSMESLSLAGVQVPDAIITGTAFGCLADTNDFLTRMVEFKETLLSPTAFIQSTHNTVGAQIALQLKCHQYNNTFVHRGSSFEAATLDALSLLQEGDARNVLVGAVDEIIDNSHAIIRRFGGYKPDGDSARLLQSATAGTMAGEGAAFFVLGSENSGNAVATLDAVRSYYKPGRPVANLIRNFLIENDVAPEDLDLVILGSNGDARIDAHYADIAGEVFAASKLAGFKNYCGEYPTASAFALWMAVEIIRHGKQIQQTGVPRKIFIYNNYKLNYPSFYLLTAC